MPSEKDGLLALALARGMTQAEAATEAGVGERTVCRRLDDPAFRATVARFRSRLMDRAVGRLAAASDRAIDRLLELVDNSEDIIRLRASKVLLDQLVKQGIFHDHDARLGAVEDRLEAKPRITVAGADLRYAVGDPRRCEYNGQPEAEAEEGEEGEEGDP
jgi:hypothetical protein